MRQKTFAEGSFERYRKRTRREQFLEEMDKVVPWQGLCALVEPVYPNGLRFRVGVGHQIRFAAGPVIGRSWLATDGPGRILNGSFLGPGDQSHHKSPRFTRYNSLNQSAFVARHRKVATSKTTFPHRNTSDSTGQPVALHCEFCRSETQ